VTTARTRRSVLNNLFVYLNRYPDPAYPESHDINMDGNLHWCAAAGAKVPDGFLDKVRTAKGSKAVQVKYPGGWEASAIVADPAFLAFDSAPAAKNDYRLKKDSPAVGKGVVLPKDLPDPQRPAEGTRPDIGAFPLGAEAPRYGRQGWVTFPVAGTE
jgi:hypothetical protein